MIGHARTHRQVFLRMMAEADLCYELSDESTWGEVVEATILVSKNLGAQIV